MKGKSSQISGTTRWETWGAWGTLGA